MNELVDVISRIASDKTLLRDFLEDLLTPTEQSDIPRRFQIVKKLSKGVPHQVIAEELGVGVATVTRGSRELKNMQGGFRRTLKKTGLA